MMQKVIAASEPPSMRRRLKSSYFAAMSALQPLLHPRSPPRFQQFWGNMERLSWGRPLLFLYSADDPLCDAAKVDELVAEKRRRGQDVKARKWERSGHVAHLRHHSDEYTDLLLQFLALTAQDAATGTLAAPTKGAASTGGAVGPRSKL
jgi:pimeloyl-ACP methyl ester carboxylesterase